MKIDVIDQIGAVTRTVVQSELDGRPAATVIATRTFDTDIADVWDAITNPERLPRWFLPISGELRLGGRYQLQGNAGGEITGCEPPKRLALTWEFGGAISWVTVRLTELEAERTELVLEHLAHVDHDHYRKFGPGAVGIGWELGLVGLARHLTTGASNDPKETEAWYGTDEAKAFMRQSGDGWRDADIAGGTDAKIATERSEQTIAFYSGEGGHEHAEPGAG